MFILMEKKVARTRRRKSTDQIISEKESKNRKTGITKRTTRNNNKTTLRQINLKNLDQFDEEFTDTAAVTVN